MYNKIISMDKKRMLIFCLLGKTIILNRFNYTILTLVPENVSENRHKFQMQNLQTNNQHIFHKKSLTLL